MRSSEVKLNVIKAIDHMKSRWKHLYEHLPRHVLFHKFETNLVWLFTSRGNCSEGHCKFFGDNGFNHFSQCPRIQRLCPVTSETWEDWTPFQKFVGLFNIWLQSIVSLGGATKVTPYIWLSSRAVPAWQGHSGEEVAHICQSSYS